MRKKTTPAPKGKFAQLAHPITQVVILNPYIQGQTKANRDAHLDIRCKDSKGNRFIVEMQTGRQKHFFKRAVYYSSMAISGGGKKGEFLFAMPTKWIASRSSL
jgi:predicted transposase/invertase (TIGR01784 family)